MKWLKPLAALVVAAALFYVLNSQWGMIPPAGKFLDPFSGFWQNNSTQDEIPLHLELAGLRGDVSVVWDDRRVPHVFAENDHDLYLAQGYLTARDRLWQMEFQIMAASGRLAEIVGEQALEHDISRRRLGMLYAAEKKLQKTLEHEPSREALEAFTIGVNEFIDGLDRRSLPLEYKILDYEPEAWTPLKSILLIQYMGWGLNSYGIDDLTLTRARAVFDDATIGKLYPELPPYTKPIVTRGLWPGGPKAPDPPDSLYHYSRPFEDVSHEKNSPRGSNNWAVAPEKTSSGHALLCNDPHLGLNLPSIWYEMQLASPDVNVYGVTLPGAPGVIIGFNEDIAWGVTNAETDVIDWYDIEFKDSTCAEYLYDGDWRKTVPRIEEVHVRGGQTTIDTIFYTHHGPVVYRDGEEPYGSKIPVGCAMRWTAHEPSSELRTFHELNRARDYEDYRSALQYFLCPGQNFAFASVDGDIAIVHQGLYPIRWEGQGRFVGDGRDPAYEWAEFMPNTLLPEAKNPEDGFVVSANQAPADSSYPFYLSGNYAPHERSSRINELLSRNDGLAPDDMMELQRDVLNMHARRVLPTLLEAVDREGLNAAEIETLDTMAAWDFLQKADATPPSVFEFWWNELDHRIWEDDMQAPDGDLRFPRRDITTALILEEPDSRFFDIITSPERETLSQIVTASFQAAVTDLTGIHGEPGSSWAWGKVRGTNISHLAGIPGLGVTDLPADGRAGTVNAITGTHGPSWRMVVELGEEVRAWGIYPGGQSGNPGSAFYANAVEDWVEGDFYELLFLRGSDDERTGDLTRTTMGRKQ